MIILYTLTIFLGAGLLFAVQPLFGRLLLPLLGGAPAVWNTCLVFFQAALLAGYGYAHWLSRRVRPARQVWVHGAVLGLALVALPIAVPAGWTPPVERNPIPWLLTVAAITVGLPFVAVAATSPLLQCWFSTTNHPAARDPYFLYAASNIGSFTALVAYPVLIEPHWGLRQQAGWWAVGYGLWMILIFACARTVSTASEPRSGDAVPASSFETVAWRRKLRWLLLALVPSSLMVSVTGYISTDLAAIPLLWVIPLALYLGTFSLAFARRQWLGGTIITRLARFLLMLVVITLALRATAPLALLIPVHLLGLLAVGLACHRELAQDRPTPDRLTEFYLSISLGGVLGGALTALVAPVLFHSIVEYPLGLLGAALLVPDAPAQPDSPTLRRRDLLWPVVVLFAGVLLVAVVNRFPALAATTLASRLVIAGPALAGYRFVRRRVRFALGLVVVLWLGAWQETGGRHMLRAERTFFGVHRVQMVGGFHRLLHGTTAHGLEARDPARRGEPLMYYARSGPLGQVMDAVRSPDGSAIAAVGLGAGAAAGHARAGQDWTFYEIDPAVERIARDPELFTHLAGCPARVAVVLGDARLTLGGAADGCYRVLILDAYNSDAIPLHLITREAVQLYLRKLQPAGLLVWHITNRHLELEPVVAALARDAGLAARAQHERILSPAEEAAGKAPSHWVVMARDAAALGALADDPRWRPLREEPGTGAWTDDYANLFSVLAWGKRR